MLGTYSYHEIFRKTIVAFGTLFNNIELRRTNEVMKVPLAYGPKQKFLARLDQNADPTNKRVQITLPRISFEINSMNYDSSRKVSPTQKIVVKNSDNKDKDKKVFMPVPYNLGFELSVISKNQEDGLQIIEQILPYFQPHYNLAVKLLPEMGEIKDVPVILNSIEYEDDYEGDFASRRAIIYTLQFTAKTYLYGPVVESKPIRKVITDVYSENNLTTAPRVQRYQITPQALVDRDGVTVTTLGGNISISQKQFTVADASGLTDNSNIQIDDEVMRIQRISGNTIHVIRAWNDTTGATHIGGTAILALTEADDAYIMEDDDFGFNELVSEFTDIKKRNPISGNDEAI